MGISLLRPEHLARRESNKFKNLKVLAESQNGVEMVKVPGKDIYGLQFHPEYEDQNNKGKILFEKVLKDIFLFD
jgi:gamma-glutamyl-gamma-aminobutyrate hydrolase PuuD